jgi:F420-non-reducing hydrogenase large subunit
MSVDKAARALIKSGTEITEGMLNKIEMAWRPYDLCLGCATHTLEGTSPVPIYIYNSQGNLIRKV